MKFRIFFISVSITLLISCQSELFQSEEIKNYPGVDNRLWDYFSSFEQEARYRNININLVGLGITGEIKYIPEDGVAGTCQYGQHIAHVTVDNNYWNSMGNLRKEYVVFHELGHCVLNRDHEEGILNNGSCRSIMNSGLVNCRNAYGQSTRSYYLDELFSKL